MKQFITKKKIKVPRYKLCYFVLAFSIFLIFGVNLLLNVLLNHTSQDGFLNVFVGNSFGNIMDYRLSNLNETYFYHNSFGLSMEEDKTVMKDYGSLKDIQEEELRELVYLYNTFQTDKYKSNYFNSYSISSYVTQASFILKEYLAVYYVGSLVEEESVVKVAKEQNLPYTNSYAASRILLERRVEEHPSLTYYFDLQLSDYDYEETTVEIDGVSYAKILFVVGTQQGNYLFNQSFATRLNEILLDIQPDLSRGVSLRGGVGYQGVYNQDFSPHALLIQVGGIHNTIDEVNRSLKVLARVIASYIEEVNLEEE